MANEPIQPFQQTCPHCGAVLELPQEAAGRRSLCPSCRNEFLARSDEARETETPAEIRQPRTQERFHKVTIETIFGDTQTLFTVGRRKLFLPGLIIGVLFVLLVIVPIIGLNQYAQTNVNASLGITIVVSPLFVLVTAYVLSVGLHLSDRLCDVDFTLPAIEGSAWLSDALQPRLRLIRRTGVCVVLLLLLGGIGLTATALTLFAANQSTVIATTLLLYAFGFLISVLVPVMLAMSFWPLLPLCLTDHPMVDILRSAIKIAVFDLFNSFLIAVATTFLMGLGMAFVGMGLIVTLPLAVLLLVVAVRRSTGQPITVLDQ